MLANPRKKQGYQPLPPGPATSVERTVSGGKRSSPALRRDNSLPRQSTTLSQNVPGNAARQKDKYVPLQSGGSGGAAAAAAAATPAGVQRYPVGDSAGSAAPDTGDEYARAPGPTIFEDIEGQLYEPRRVSSGRITVMTVSEGLDRTKLEVQLRDKYPKHTVHTYQEVVHATPSPDGDELPSSDIFFFDYGTVVFWAMSAAEEQAVLTAVVNPAKTDPLSPSEVEIDEFQFIYSAHELPHIQNDRITLNKSSAGDHQVQLAISHALAQSTKLGIYEERLSDIVNATRHLPEGLAREGKVDIGRKEIARLIGQVFLQRAAVNLLSTVMDTPEFFWSAPDHLQVLYKRVCEYLELDTRVDVLNARFQVLQEMLDMLRDQQNNAHMSRLEWIVIYLIVIEVLVGLVEVAGLLGWTPTKG